jgi:heme/copper-type cytochrome/quinol oxidase subunit 1
MGAVFSIFAGVFYWFPMIAGLCFNSVLLVGVFFSLFLGVNLTFFPQHFLGLAGFPRRYSDFRDTFSFFNFFSSFGRIISFFGALLFLLSL